MSRASYEMKNAKRLIHHHWDKNLNRSACALRREASFVGGDAETVLEKKPLACRRHWDVLSEERLNVPVGE
jgi:hypothetical protein